MQRSLPLCDVAGGRGKEVWIREASEAATPGWGCFEVRSDRTEKGRLKTTLCRESQVEYLGLRLRQAQAALSIPLPPQA